MYVSEDVTSAKSLATFRRLLNTQLSRKSFPDYMLDINLPSTEDLAVVPLLRPPKNLLIDCTLSQRGLPAAAQWMTEN